MNWESFEESKRELPDEVVQRTTDGFSTATKDLAELAVFEASDTDRIASRRLNTRFQFKLILTSKHLEDYEYKVLEFGYNTKLYPVTVVVSQDFASELIGKFEITGRTTYCDGPETLEALLRVVFATANFKEVVSGLMKIARKKKEDNPPF